MRATTIVDSEIDAELRAVAREPGVSFNKRSTKRFEPVSLGAPDRRAVPHASASNGDETWRPGNFGYTESEA